MNQCEPNPLIVCYDRLGSVPVMAIKIPIEIRSQLGFCNASSHATAYVSEITETHRSIPRGMMSRRTHQTECGLAPQRATRCLDHRHQLNAARARQYSDKMACRDRNRPPAFATRSICSRECARSNSPSIAAEGFRQSQSGCRSFRSGAVRAIRSGRSGWPGLQYCRQLGS